MKGSGLNIQLAEGAVSPTNSKASKFDSQALRGLKVGTMSAHLEAKSTQRVSTVRSRLAVEVRYDRLK